MATDFTHGNFTIRLYSTDEAPAASDSIRGYYCGHPISDEAPFVTGETATLFSSADDAETAAKAIAIPAVEVVPGWKPS